MGMLKEFRDFALRGNVFDLAVAFVMGAAFAKIVSSFVDNVMMPPIGMAAGKVDFSKLSYVMARDAEGKPSAELKYGMFVQNVVDFALVAMAVFLMVKLVTAAIRRSPPPPPAPPKPTREQELLTEIRDLLRTRG